MLVISKVLYRKFREFAAIANEFQKYSKPCRFQIVHLRYWDIKKLIYINSPKPFLGGSARTLQEHLGKYDEIEKYEGNSYVWYNSIKANFFFRKDDIVRWVYAPHADACGHAYLHNPDYYTIDGLVQGMSKDDVERIWGKADSEGNSVWGYKNRGGITKTGEKFELAVEFKEVDYEYKLACFMVEIVKNETVEPEKPKSGCFIATACYGDYEASEVLVLRHFRDSVLLESSVGKVAVNIYYFLSPPFARLIAKSDILKTAIRKYLLTPIVSNIKRNQNNQL